MSKGVLSLAVVLIIFTLSACHKGGKAVVPEQASKSAGEIEPSDVVKGDSSGTSSGLNEVATQLRPVFFDFNSYTIRDDQEKVLRDNAGILRSDSSLTVIVQGHCDERGTEEYNLALGERRANAVKQYLLSLGIDAKRVNVVSFGESKPFELGHSEQAWQLNRRAQPVAVR